MVSIEFSKKSCAKRDVSNANQQIVVDERALGIMQNAGFAND